MAFSCFFINAAKCPSNKQDLKAMQNYHSRFESGDTGAVKGPF